jgi:hypothetical protein
VVEWLRRMERLEAALALAPTAVLDAIASHAPDVVPSLHLVRARRELAAAAARAPRAADHASPPAAAAAAPTPSAPPDGRAPPPPAIAAAPPGSTPPGPGRGDAAETAGPAVAELAAAMPATAAPSTPVPGAEPPAAGVAATGDAVAIETRAAGLFYLAGRVLEIDLAERLWAAGLPEGDVLALIATAIAGDDPACAWFGGRFERRPAIPTVEAWAAAEVSELVQHALGRRLVRFGVARSPATLAAQLDELAAEAALSLELSPLLRRIVERGAAALACIVAARLERAPSLHVLRAVCARPGRLVLTPDTLHVVMPHTAVDVAHRRAGLDHDPGHVPWLGRRVRFEFAGGEEA